MKTIDALKHYATDLSLSPAQIADELKMQKLLISRWLKDENLPTGERTIRLQEFLITKGYLISEVANLPDFVKVLRACFFAGTISAEKILDEVQYTDICYVWRFFRDGRCDDVRKQKYITLLSQIAQPLVSQTYKDSSLGCDLDQELEKAFETLQKLGKFLKKSTPVDRHQLREKHPRLFDCSNVLAAACSNKAYECWLKENR